VITLIQTRQFHTTHTVPQMSTLSSHFIGRVSYLIYVSMRHYVLTTSGDIVVSISHDTHCPSNENTVTTSHWKCSIIYSQFYILHAAAYWTKLS